MPTPNVVKYSPSSLSNSIRRNNVVLGIENTDFAPTSTTGYWNGITPPANGVTIYSLPSGSTTPSIVCPDSDLSIMYWAGAIKGQTVTNVNDALGYLTTGTTNTIAANFDYPNVVTSGLTLFVDFGFTPSYPRTGTIVYDLSSSVSNGNLINNPPWSGITQGGSILLNGASQYIDFRNILDYQSSDFTFSFWVNPNSLSTNTSGQGPTLFQKGNSRVSGYYCQISTGGTLSFTTAQAAASQTTTSTSSILSAGTWYNLSIVRSGSTVTLFVNGVNRNASSATHINPTSTSDGFTIGINSGSTTYSNILVNNFMSYNRALTSTEVLQNYNALSQRNSLIYIGGNFSYYNSNPSRNFILLNNINGDVSQSYNTGVGFDSSVYSLSKDSTGKIICAGSINSYNGTAVSYGITRLTSSLSIDPTFSSSTSFDNVVYSVATDSNNKLYCGGAFFYYGVDLVPSLVRLNNNGSIDNTFNVGSGFDNYIWVVKVLSNGKVLVGGAFTTYRGATCTQGIVRLNSNGSLDTTFTGGTGVNGNVNTIEIDSNGKYVIGGSFTSYSGVTSNRILRINSDGSIDNTFVIGTGFNSIVWKVLIDSLNSIYAVGQFIDYSGVTNYRIAKLLSNGSLDTTFVNSGFTYPGSYYLYDIEFDNNNNLLVGGNYNSYGSSSIYCISMLSTGGILNTSFNPSPGLKNTNILSSVIYTILPLDGSNILVGGQFSNWNSYNMNRLASLNYDGTNNPMFTIGTGFNTAVYSLGLTSNKDVLYAVGAYSLFNGNSQEQATKLSPKGTLLFNGSYFAGTGPVNVIKVDSSNKPIFGGDFSSYGGAVLDIVRALTTMVKDTTFQLVNTGGGFGKSGGAAVYDIKIDTNGKILVGGDFTSYSGVSVTNLMRMNSNSYWDSTFTNASFNGIVYGVNLDNNQSIIAVGAFTSYSSTTINRIVKINVNGGIDTSFTVGTGFNGTTKKTAIDINNKIVVGGSFTTYSGASYNRIIRLNNDGTIDTTFSIGTGFDGAVEKVFIDSNNKIYATGSFTSYNGYIRNRLIRLNIDGTVDTSFNPFAGADQTINDIII